MKIVKYTSSNKKSWDTFVENSKNGHFCFFRDFMEYHAERFEDYSLLIYDDFNLLFSILPANIKETTLYSHQGLTFGGFLINDTMTTQAMLDLFTCFKEFLKKEGIQKLVYKSIPYIYHVKPSEEDRYAFFRNDAIVIRRDVTSALDLTEDIKYSKGRKWTVNKAAKNNLIFEQSDDLVSYWSLLEEVLNVHHKTKPTHSLNEIQKLSHLFPNNIKLFIATQNDILLAGALIYEYKHIIYTQYLANSLKGRECGALDFVLDTLIKKVYFNKKYFNFGISNEDNGRYLNTGLIAQKEGFGARAVVNDVYEMEIL